VRSFEKNILASFSSKPPQIETTIRAWQWRFTRSHVTYLCVAAGNELKLRCSNVKQLRQNGMLQKEGSFLASPKT